MTEPTKIEGGKDMSVKDMSVNMPVEDESLNSSSPDINSSRLTGEQVQRKLAFLFEKKKPVHVETSSGKFYNGDVVSMGSDFFVIKDRKLGECFLFFNEISIVDMYIPTGRDFGVGDSNRGWR